MFAEVDPRDWLTLSDYERTCVDIRAIAIGVPAVDKGTSQM